MRAVVQRVARASVTVEGRVVGSIGEGLLVLVGVGRADGIADADALADKLADLRIFPDGEGKMNRSLVEEGGGMLVVSQFTLHGDVRRGRRPSFTAAAPPQVAAPLVDRLVEQVEGRGIRCETGVFGAHMSVDLVNDGPVTLIVETAGGRVV